MAIIFNQNDGKTPKTIKNYKAEEKRMVVRPRIRGIDVVNTYIKRQVLKTEYRS